MRRQLFFEEAYNPDTSVEEEDIEFCEAVIYVDKDMGDVVLVIDHGELRFGFDEWAHIEAFVKSELRTELE